MLMFPTAADVLNHARPKEIPPFTDTKLLALCQQCTKESRLSEAKLEATPSALNYRCSTCNDILVIIRPPNFGGVPVPNSGYRLGDWVFPNAVDVRIEGFDRLLFPAKENATTTEIRIKQARSVDDSDA